jgi:Ser/Thr protein kinase RdoA (MazF antagonist)
MTPDLTAIARHFQFEGSFLEASPYGFGHINDTYAAWFRPDDPSVGQAFEPVRFHSSWHPPGHAGSRHRYILQRINHHVFKNPEELMHNIAQVTRHLRAKILAAGGDPERETLSLIPTLEGGTFYRTADGHYWRAYIFIEGAQTYEIVASLDHIYNAAKAFGNFQRLLADFPADQLHETIPDFHHTRKRFDAFVQSVERDALNRAGEVRPEIEFVARRVGDTSILLDLLAQGKLPERVTHNDCKFNNVMIDDQTGEGICVIDLDTVMPGLSLYDFGDTVRSGANTAAEDEPDLSRVHLDLEIFDRLAHGYLDSARDFLTPLEIDHLAFSARLMTLECGLRFLADHLDGDVYFKVHRPNHNLDRCRTQFKLVQEMEQQFDRMLSIVEKYR